MTPTEVSRTEDRDDPFPIEILFRRLLLKTGDSDRFPDTHVHTGIDDRLVIHVIDVRTGCSREVSPCIRIDTEELGIDHPVVEIAIL